MEAVPTQRARCGFTLIETVIAIFIFSVGALGLAATTAIVLRSLGESGARERAARVAAARLETLRSLVCGAGQAGSEELPGLKSTWTVTPSAGSVSAQATVSYVLAGKSRTESYSTVFPCK